jgi:Predicted lipoprotein of unknown function (DUF2380)
MKRFVSIFLLLASLFLSVQAKGDYDPTVQRFIEMDPIGEAGGINLYRFVGNNPANRIDPLGLWWWDNGYIQQGLPQLIHDLLFANDDNPAPPADPNSFGAQHGIDNNFDGETAGDLTSDFGKAVPAGVADAAMMLGGEGEAKSAYEIADEALKAAEAAKAAKAANKCEKVAKAIEKHHLLPRQFAHKFKQVGLDPDDYLLNLPVDEHRLSPDGLHAGPSEESWNGQWSQFFDNNPNYTQQDVLNQLATMIQQFGLK